MTTRTLFIALAALVLTATAAEASDPYGYGPAFDFEGLYIGGYAGAGLNAPGTDATVGGIAGVNFDIADPVMAGAEVQGGIYGHKSGTAWDLLALGHLGVLLTDDVLAYGALGGGIETAGGTRGVWAGGAGAEVAVTDSLSARGEALLTHDIAGDGALTKVTAGLLWHIQ